MNALKIGAKAATQRLTYGQKSLPIFALAIGCFLIVTFGFDLLVPKLLTGSRVGIYVAGGVIGIAVYRLIMRLSGAPARSRQG